MRLLHQAHVLHFSCFCITILCSSLAKLFSMTVLIDSLQVLWRLNASLTKKTWQYILLLNAVYTVEILLEYFYL